MLYNHAQDGFIAGKVARKVIPRKAGAIRGQPDVGILAEVGEGFRGSCWALQGPFVVLHQQQSADQAVDGRLVG